MSLPKDQIKTYWQDRSAKQDELTVGNGGMPIEIQDKEYSEKSEFIFSLCPRDMATLDFGCGTGRYAKFFDYYLGADLTENLLKIAKKNNPDKNFILLDNECLEGCIFSGAHLVFTSTVLQHCSDEVCKRLLLNLRVGAQPHAYFFYENSVPAVSGHVKGRSSDDYKKLLESAKYKIRTAQYKTHTVHGESHTASLFTV